MGDSFTLLRETLKKVDFFYSLNMGDLDQLVQVLKKRKAEKKEQIIKQGEIGDKFYLIASGEFSVHVKKGGMGSPQKVASLGQADFFGEMALVTELPRTATVICEEAGELFVLYKKDFKKILLQNPRISAIINEVLSKRRAQNR
jgi:CRP-like cAMP-binding protein